jgi:glutathione synthase/RimK-type ligase-like ATP-grasp enzyme
MLSRYSFIVAKPIVGAGGHGVVKIEKLASGLYRYHYKEKSKVHKSWDALISDINRIRKGRKYMLQQGIDLATVNGRRVDYRVTIVKRGGAWRITAVVARLARPGLFVTNLCRGGTMMKGTAALKRTFPALVKRKRKTMIGVARTCTYLLESRYPGIGALGFDFGIDKKGTVWIFEVNTRPQ